MDLGRLFRACRLGNLPTVRELILTKDVDVNIRDKWDSSPLYYACLCGHTELVHFLLANGARCEANTFDGERCVYGALTNEIRNILVRDYKVINRKVVQRRDYDEFLRKALDSGELHDVVFSVHGIQFKAHKCVLVARCQYLLHMFRNKWSARQVVHINHPAVSPSAFQVLLQYLYTGILEFPLSLKEDLSKLLRQCKLLSVLQLVEQHANLSSGRAKSKSKQSNIMIELPVEEHYFHLYRNALPLDLTGQAGPERLPSDFDAQPELSQFSDVIFKVQHLYFQCHRLFFCGRSDFFRALLSDNFYEIQETINGVRVYELTEISIQAFDALIAYIYTNTTMLSMETAFELLLQSDVYLMNSLKKFCANIIGSYVSQLNVIDLIKMSRVLDLPKLEMTAVEYISSNLDQFLGNPHFQELVISDANEVKERQETDTIGIIDDVRYYLKSSSRKDIDTQLEAINVLLDTIGLKLSNG